ncbi:hypothetical protein ANT2_1662 [plant metagenome]|uniref:Uncharacterized protein n=1 Tax=plant metagenome TaxID=1297885 RepID=A0A484PDS0_9ZZZZ
MCLGLIAATLAGVPDTVVAIALLWLIVPWQCRRYLRTNTRAPTRAERRVALSGMTAVVVGVNTVLSLMLLPSSPFPAQDLAARNLLLGGAWLTVPMYAALLWLFMRSVWGAAPRRAPAAQAVRAARDSAAMMAVEVPVATNGPDHLPSASA